jgi:site-specific DNA recombinase
MFAACEIDARQLATATATLRERETEIAASIAAMGCGVRSIELAGRNVRKAWFGTKPDRSDGLTLGQRRAIIDALVTVTVLPAPSGRRSNGTYFNPAFVRIEWKR